MLWIGPIENFVQTVFPIYFERTATKKRKRGKPSFVTCSISWGDIVLFSLLTLSKHFKHEKLFQPYSSLLYYSKWTKKFNLQFVIDSFAEKNVSKISVLQNMIVLILSEISIRQRTISIIHYYSLLSLFVSFFHNLALIHFLWHADWSSWSRQCEKSKRNQIILSHGFLHASHNRVHSIKRN